MAHCQVCLCRERSTWTCSMAQTAVTLTSLPPSLAPLFGTSGPPPPESLRLADDTDTARPVYHFLAPANWMNDPQPIVYVQGRYHLFYEVRHPPSLQLHPPTQPTPNPHLVTCHAHHQCLQQYNPYSAVWYNMTWGHASSAGMCAQRDGSASASPLTDVCLFVWLGVAQTCFTGPTTRLPSTLRSPLITLECGLAHWYLQMLRRPDLKYLLPSPSRATHTIYRA